MQLVASSEGVSICCPEGGKFSFFNSPYYAHKLCTAVDIYPSSRKNSGFAPSPVSGEVIGIKAVRHFYERRFECSDVDYVLLLRSRDNPERLVKVLHVKPHLKVGDFVKTGENLGKLIRSGFFDFWTELHIHVEVREPSNPMRARGGFKIERVLEANAAEELNVLRGKVVESNREYSLIAINEDLAYGFPVKVNGEAGLLDGGIPHYGFFGIHTDAKPTPGREVSLCGRKIGKIISVSGNMATASFNAQHFKLKDEEVGLSFYLHLSKPLLKVVPRKLGGLTLNKNEEVEVNIC